MIHIDELTQTLQETNWVNPTVASAANYTSSISGPTGVKMSGPYSWVPPNYWLEDTQVIVKGLHISNIDIYHLALGWNGSGRCLGIPDRRFINQVKSIAVVLTNAVTSGGPGENPLTYEALAATIQEDEMNPILNSYWDYHCGNPEVS